MRLKYAHPKGSDAPKRVVKKDNVDGKEVVAIFNQSNKFTAEVPDVMGERILQSSKLFKKV